MLSGGHLRCGMRYFGGCSNQLIAAKVLCAIVQDRYLDPEYAHCVQNQIKLLAFFCELR